MPGRIGAVAVATYEHMLDGWQVVVARGIVRHRHSTAAHPVATMEAHDHAHAGVPWNGQLVVLAKGSIKLKGEAGYATQQPLCRRACGCGCGAA